MNKSPISMLQELMVKMKEALPDYNIETIGEAQNIRFRCRVRAGNFTGIGEGLTKKEAKNKSAETVLLYFGYAVPQVSLPQVNNKISSPAKVGPIINYVGKLNELASTNQKPYPTYVDDIALGTNKFLVKCSFLSLKTVGYGLNKKEAKQEAASNMMEKLKEVDLLSTRINTFVEQLVAQNTEQMNNDILKKYKECTKGVESLTVQNNYIGEFSTKPLHQITTLEELSDKLKELNLNYKISVFQRNPYIMYMTINDSVLMGHGDTKKEADENLIHNACYMINNGFYFVSTLGKY